MFRLQSLFRVVFLVFLITLLSACNLPFFGGSGDSNGSINETAVAQTVQANQTAIAQSKATQDAAQENGGTNGSGLKDDATFIADVTIPDQSYIEKGANFSKTWRVQNSGESTWTTEYRLVFDHGDQMGSPEFVSMPKEVKPGETVDITVEFTAPDTPGEYKSSWMLQNNGGNKFGVGTKGDLPVFVWIFSVEPNQAGSGGISGGAEIGSVTLGIDQAVYSGACPANLTLSWTIATNNAGAVQHTLDLVPNTSGFTFFPVDMYYANFNGAGSQGFEYLLIISDSVNATARVNATGSSTVLSNLVGFSVNCQ
ncbi:MAG: NBR1-Ig-like domain-containing protein [Anaerolineales bacterium]|jgi:hypothetical protein